MDGVEVRELTLDDYEEVIALWRATEGVGLSAADTRESIARYLARNPGMSFVARTEDGRLVGAVLCGHDGRRGYLHHLAVNPGWRGQGIGRKLVENCMNVLQADGIGKCHLFVYNANEIGRAFWTRTGWVERTNLLIMSKDL